MGSLKYAFAAFKIRSFSVAFQSFFSGFKNISTVGNVLFSVSNVIFSVLLFFLTGTLGRKQV